MSRRDWYYQTSTTVGTKQLLDTLGINPSKIYNDFGTAVMRNAFAKADETYTPEDIAMSKQISKKLIEDWAQSYCNSYFFKANSVLPFFSLLSKKIHPLIQYKNILTYHPKKINTSRTIGDF